MSKSVAAIVWLAGFIIAVIYLPSMKTESPFLWGFFSGLIWTALIISMTKKTDGKEKSKG